SSNHFAGYLEAVGVMGLSITMWGRLKVWARLLIGYATLVCYAGIAIAGSRGGYLSTLCSLVAFAALSLYVLLTVERGRFILVSLLLAGGLTIAVAVAIHLMSTSITLSMRMAMLTHDPDRPYLWQAALQEFRLSPAFGTGTGTYRIWGRF